MKNKEAIIQITDDKLDKYESITKRALDKAKIIIPKGTHLYKIAKDYFEMANNYFNDAKHFRNNNDYVNAFAALNYAHGWLDAGARLGIFDVDHDNILFTVD